MVDLRVDSRYLLTNILTDENGKEYFDVWESINIKSQNDDRVLSISEIDLGRFDRVTNNLYSNSSYWWVIFHFNDIDDPFSEIDFSDADHQISYPNYYLQGGNAKISLPEEFSNTNLLALGIDPLNVELSDLPKIMKYIKVPEYNSSTKFNVPSRNNLQEVMSDAQNRSTANS
jgi:hypothetical protein